MFPLFPEGFTIFSIVLGCCLSTPRDCMVQYEAAIITEDCSWRGLTSVPTSLLSDVTELRLTRNKIRNVTGSALSRYQSLIILDLSYNELETLAWECLPESLVKLDLSNNLITDNLCTDNRLAIQPVSWVEYRVPSMLTQLTTKQVQSQNDGDSTEKGTARDGTTSTLPNLQVLFLDQNKIGNLSADCFRNLGLTFLQVLTLSDNQLDVLRNGTFRGLDRLQKLVLSNNQLQQLELESLTGLEHLHTLYLDSNHLDSSHGSLPPGVFRSVGLQLTELYIYGNSFAGHRMYPEEALSDLTSLETLAIDTFPYYEKDSAFGSGFGAMRRLQVLDLSNSRINRLTNNSFQAFANSTLQVLRINDNSQFLDILQSCAFCPLKNLTVLALDHIKALRVSFDDALATFYAFRSSANDDSRVVDFVKINTFSDYMSRNVGAQLTSINAKYLQDTCLRHLDLRKNHILHIEHNALMRPGSRFSSCIQSVNLADNMIIYTDLLEFASAHFAPQLVSFEIHSQFVFRIQDALEVTSRKWGPSDRLDDFRVQLNLPSSLQFVNMSGIFKWMTMPTIVTFHNASGMRVFDLSYTNLRTCMFVIEGLETLEYLSMSGTNCRDTSLSFFDAIPSVKTLIIKKMNFEENFVAAKGPRLFAKLNKIETFDLSFNGLKVLPPDTFFGQPALQNLILLGNLLESLDLNLLYHRNLSFLDLSGNKLSYLTKGQRDMLDVLVAGQDNPLSLHIQGNPIACTCSTLDFVRWLGTTRVALDLGGDYSCVTDDGQLSTTGAVGREWLSVWRRCVGPRVLLSSVVGMLLLLSLTGLAWGVVKNYSRLHFLFSVLTRIKMPKRKDFHKDAYVAYCDTDSELVINVLRRQLQVLRDVQLLIKDMPRNQAGSLFYQLPGDNIALKILEHIDMCWKIVFVLTPALINDPMAGFMTRAVLQSITDRLPRRVLLLCVGIPHMPELAGLEALLKVVPEHQVFFLPRADSRNPRMWDSMAEIILHKP